MAIADIAALLNTAFGQSPSSKSVTSDVSGLKRISGQATANADNALGNLLPILQEAARQAAIAYAPTLVGQNRAGVYNSSTNRLLAQQAARSTAAQQAGVVSQYKTDQQKIALGAETAAAAGNQRQVSESTGLLSAIQPYILPAAGGYMALKNAPDIIDALKDPGAAFDKSAIGQAVGKLTSPSVDAATGSGVVGPAITRGAVSMEELAAPGGASFEAGSGFSQPITGSTGAVGSELYGPFDTPADILADQGATVENLSATSPDLWVGGGELGGDLWSGAYTTDIGSTAGFDIAADAGLSGAGDFASEFAGEGLSYTTDIGIDGGAEFLAEGLGEVGAQSLGEYLPYVGTAFNFANAGQAFAEGDIAGGLFDAAAGAAGAMIPYGGLIVRGIETVAEPVVDFVGDVAGGIGEVFSGGSVVCTLLAEQGKLNRDDLRQSGIKFNKRYSRLAKEAYYLWSRPAVKYMKANPKTWLAERITKIMQRRTDYVCGRGFFKEASAFWEVEIFTTVLGVLALPWLLYKVYGSK